jgi:hypothetical protein
MSIAVKDSKQQLMQAFQQIIADRKKLENKIATKQEEAEKAKNKETLEAASTYTVDSIVKGLADLQLEFGSIVNQLSEKLATQNSKLDELNRAREIATQNLQELQQIRIVADALDILTQEHREKLKTLEEDIRSKREALEKEIAQKRKEWQKEQTEYEEALQAYNESLAKQRSLETDEYQYKLETSRKLNTDAYEAIKKSKKTRNIKKKIGQNEKKSSKNVNLYLQNINRKLQPFLTKWKKQLRKLEKKQLKKQVKRLKLRLICWKKIGSLPNKTMKLKFNLWNKQFRSKLNR